MGLMRVSSFGFAFLLALSATVAHAQNPNEFKSEKIKLAKLEKNYGQTKAAWAKDKTNAGKKKAYVNATVTLATAVMTSPMFGPKDKYPRALRLYREALKVDPKNQEAKENSRMIEDIYRQMGRPIPK